MNKLSIIVINKNMRMGTGTKFWYYVEFFFNMNKKCQFFIKFYLEGKNNILKLSFLACVLSDDWLTLLVHTRHKRQCYNITTQRKSGVLSPFRLCIGHKRLSDTCSSGNTSLITHFSHFIDFIINLKYFPRYFEYLNIFQFVV